MQFIDTCSSYIATQVCETDTLDKLSITLNQLTTELALVTNKNESGTMGCPDDLINIVLLLDFIIK